MRSLGRVGLALGLVAALTAGPAEAQHAQRRAGFTFGVGLGYGWMSLGCDDCASGAGGEREGGLGGNIMLGAALAPTVVVGAEATGWSRTGDDSSLFFTNVSGSVYFYPMAAQGLFLKGGIGTSVVKTVIGSGGFGSQTESERGLGLLLGAGYDLRLGTNPTVTPVVNYFHGSFAGSSADLVQVGLGITFY
jgi:hypothetical protein